MDLSIDEYAWLGCDESDKFFSYFPQVGMMNPLKNLTTEENKYTLTGMEELEVAAAILVVFLVMYS